MQLQPPHDFISYEVDGQVFVRFTEQQWSRAVKLLKKGVMIDGFDIVHDNNGNFLLLMTLDDYVICTIPRPTTQVWMN